MSSTLPSSVLLQAAQFAAGAQQYPSATLYVVATPIGNFADLSLRAIHVLATVHAVACEDTRVTGQMLHRLGVSPALMAVHQHNESQAAERVIERLALGERVAFVSDAGTPAVSDPGARLVAAVRQAGFNVVPLPGPSSVLTALSVAGDIGSAGEKSGGGFRFVGFLPPKGAERSQAIQRLQMESMTTVLFEAPHRIETLMQALAEHMPERRVTLCRELTKQFEQIHTLPAAQGPAWLAEDADHRRGEFVLVLHAQSPVDAELPAQAAAEKLLNALLGALPLRQAVDLAAELSSQPRKALYARALELRQAEDAAAED
jgi:16S rRNA (cytidine1402-2'-O)-methyltransferase